MATQRVTISRQQGQWLRVRAPDGVEFYIEVEKCTSGYARLIVETSDSFEVHKWDTGQLERMRSRESKEQHPEGTEGIEERERR